MNNTKISIIGGGKRMLYCAESLGKNGLECAVFGIDAIPAVSNCTKCRNLSDALNHTFAVILPVPLTKDGATLAVSDVPIKLSEVFSQIPKEALVFAGAVSENARETAKRYDIEIHDYMEDDILSEKNAYATAEGAVMLMMQNTERTIFESKCLVSGYGRIGGYTARILKSLGAEVTVSARRRFSRSKAALDGFKSIEKGDLCDKICEFDFIINTVPAEIFTEKELSKMQSSTVYIELASAPYGVNKKTAARYNIEITDGGSLPSKYCPESAGEYIAETLRNEFERSGII